MRSSYVVVKLCNYMRRGFIEGGLSSLLHFLGFLDASIFKKIQNNYKTYKLKNLIKKIHKLGIE